jgi:hypothetical protein
MDEAAAKSAGKPLSVELVRERKKAAIAAARGWLNVNLSATARSGLDRYIRTEVKRKVVIYRG